MDVAEVRQVLTARVGEAYDEWTDEFPETGDVYVTFSGERGLLVVEAGNGFWSVQPFDDEPHEVADLDELVEALDAVG